MNVSKTLISPHEIVIKLAGNQLAYWWTQSNIWLLVGKWRWSYTCAFISIVTFHDLRLHDRSFRIIKITDCHGHGQQSKIELIWKQKRPAQIIISAKSSLLNRNVMFLSRLWITYTILYPCLLSSPHKFAINPHGHCFCHYIIWSEKKIIQEFYLLSININYLVTIFHFRTIVAIAAERRLANVGYVNIRINFGYQCLLLTPIYMLCSLWNWIRKHTICRFDHFFFIFIFH